MTPLPPAHTLHPTPAPDGDGLLLEEGARFALLQRLVPVLQHQIMGHFQSMGMINVMLDRRLQSASPDLEGLRQDCELLGSVSDSTVKSIVSLLAWVRPKPAARQRLDAGVDECATLLLSEFRLKGFDLVNEVGLLDAEVASRALRSVLCASLFCLGDGSAVQATLTLRAQQRGGSIELSVALQPHADPQPRGIHAGDSRLLNWRDVELLAGAESVGLVHSAAEVRLTFDMAP